VGFCFIKPLNLFTFKNGSAEHTETKPHPNTMAVLLGDSLELIKMQPSNSIDLVITSPPYANMKTYIDDTGIPPDKYVEWFLPFIKEIERVIKPTGSFILNINDKVVDRFRHPFVYDLISEIHKQTGLKMFERLFWNKMKGLPNVKRFGDRVEYVFWFAKSKTFTFKIDEMRVPYSEVSVKRMKKPIKDRFVRDGEEEKMNDRWSPNEKGALPPTLVSISSETKRIADNHVAVFPVPLVEYFLKGATNEGDLVLDLFAGTGTTGVACKKNNRRFIGYEKQKQYVDLANERIEKTDPFSPEN
jgi:DNA modification methylase